MTVAIGLVCSDGVLVAADSMGHSNNIAVPMVKVRGLTNAPAVWTLAGSGYVGQEVERHVARMDHEWRDGAPDCWTVPDAAGVRDELAVRLRPVVRDAYEALVTPPGEKPARHGSEFIFAGWGPDGPYMHQVHADLSISSHDRHPMATIGTGHEFAAVARALMDHHLTTPPTLHLGKLLAYRTIESVCEVSSWGVALPVQLAVADRDGARVLDEAEIEEVGMAVERWKELEREALLQQGPDPYPASPQHDLPRLPGHFAVPRRPAG